MSTYTIPVINSRIPDLSDMGFYAQVRFDADDSLPDYVGLHDTATGATSLTDWKIYKFTYSGTAVTRIQFLYGSWDGRAALSW